MDATRHQNYMTVKTTVESLGHTKMTPEEQAQMIEWAQDLLLADTDLTVAASARDEAFAFVDRLLANRPSWNESQEIGERLKTQLAACCPALSESPAAVEA
jgi:hypothetical protein